MNQEKQHLFDKPENVKRLLRLLYVICALLFLADFVLHRHSVHHWESMWGFYAIYGFTGCVVLVLVAAQMRKVVMRDEDYYEQSEAQDQTHVDD